MGDTLRSTGAHGWGGGVLGYMPTWGSTEAHVGGTRVHAMGEYWDTWEEYWGTWGEYWGTCGGH